MKESRSVEVVPFDGEKVTVAKASRWQIGPHCVLIINSATELDFSKPGYFYGITSSASESNSEIIPKNRRPVLVNRRHSTIGAAVLIRSAKQACINFCTLCRIPFEVKNWTGLHCQYKIVVVVPFNYRLSWSVLWKSLQTLGLSDWSVLGVFIGPQFVHLYS